MLCAACGHATLSETCTSCGGAALLDGRYRLEAIVGRGAMGVTYRSTALESPDGNATVAIKELPVRSLDGLKSWELFEREARVLRTLDHPCIPRYLDDFICGEGKNRSIYIVQEFVEGRTLAAELEAKRFDERSAMAVMRGILPILEYLHSFRPPVIHRDIKPTNVMRRSSDGALVLIDFGSVRDALRDPLRGGSTVTGTFGYMAPEQFRGDARPATDLYALGALLLALVTGKEPFELLDRSGGLRWRDLNLSWSTVNVLRALLEPDPDKRASCVRDVNRAMTLARPRDPSVGPRPRPGLWPTAMGVCGLVVGLAFSAAVSKPAPPPIPAAPRSAPPPVEFPLTTIPELDGELVILPGDAPLDATPPFTRKELYQVLGRVTPSINDCYRSYVLRVIDRSGPSAPPLETSKANLSFLIDEDGHLRSPTLKVSKEMARDKQMLSCFMDQIQPLQFPRPKDGRPARVSLPYYFLPRHDSTF